MGFSGIPHNNAVSRTAILLYFSHDAQTYNIVVQLAV